ncbi:MAG: peptidoglycan-binding protein LysM [Ignavibacteriae bacterium]|nr:MAG: peptidoglycan-binding protein LysM [Ignavibacteriota bacterium]
MKFYKQILVLLALLVFMSTSIIAQEEEEMDTDEWEAEIARLTDQKANLTETLNKLKSDIDVLNEKKNSLPSVDDCQDELYEMVGATEEDVANYQDKVNQLMNDISSKKPEKEVRQAQLDELKKSKLSALPGFYDLVHNKMQKMLDAWVVEPKEVDYTVVRGDHLWGIAKKKEHYGNGFAWPMIYNANRDKISNPDLIYPKQVFKVPNLSDEEVEKYKKMRANYKPAPME